MRRPARSVERAPEWFHIIGNLGAAIVRALLLAAPVLPFVLGSPPPASILGPPVVAIGYVRDAFSYRPIEGARVFAAGEAFCFETRTEASGQFVLSLPSLGSGAEPETAWTEPYEVRVQAAGYLPADVGDVDPLPDRHPVSMPLCSLMPAAARLVVRAVDEEGRVVPFVEGRLYPPGQAADGQVLHPDSTLITGPGLWTAEVRTEDLRWGEATVLLPPGPVRDRTVEVPVLPDRVARDDLGAPIAGAPVGVSRVPLTHPLSDLGDSQSDPADLYPGRAGNEGAFRVPVLPPPERVAVRVVDAATGAPLRDVLALPDRVFSDVRGRLEVDVYPGLWQDFVPRFRKAGYRDLQFSRTHDDGAVAELKMEPRSYATVRLRDAAGPCPGYLVSGSSRDGQSWTDEDGRTRLSLDADRSIGILCAYCSDGYWEKLAVRPPWSPWSLLRVLGLEMPSAGSAGREARPGETIDLGTYLIERGRPRFMTGNPMQTIQIELRDEAGRPVPHAYLVDIAGGIYGCGDPHGIIRTHMPMSHVMYCTFILSAPGRTGVAVNLNSNAGAVPAVLGEGSESRGVLLNADGSPRCGVTIFASSPDSEAPSPAFRTPPAVTDTLGRFTIHGVPPGARAIVRGERKEDPVSIGELQGGRQDTRIVTAD